MGDHGQGGLRETGVVYKGLYGSINERWNLASISETEGLVRMGKAWRNPRMPHNMAEGLLP